MSIISQKLGRAVTTIGSLVFVLLFLTSVTFGTEIESNLAVLATDCSLVTEIPPDECQELIDFYNATDGDNWNNNSGWKQTEMPCSWHGVSCSAGHVTSLSLNSNGLSGNIPDFSNLPHLSVLYLGVNQLNGSVPDFSNLPNLQRLYLNKNQLDGNVPDFSSLPNLTQLSLFHNQLTGNVPNFSNLPNLEFLSIEINQLTGSVPDFSNLPNLQHLYLNENQLSGNIPNFSNLSNLEQLELTENELSGGVPNFSGLPNLTSLSLDYNQLNGNVPNFSNFPNLEYLNLSSNQLSGNIPNFSNLSNLTKLILADNQLSGDIPNFSNLPNLRSLYLRFNLLGGGIPNFSNLHDLVFLNLNGNQLSGAIPWDMGKLINLTMLYVADNPLSGPLPMSFTNLNLDDFSFYGTQICEPQDAIMQDWLDGIPSLSRTGVLCAFLNSNHLTGSMGSYFLLSATEFPKNTISTITANNHELGQLMTDDSGSLAFNLATDEADQGTYVVKVTTQPTISVLSTSLIEKSIVLQIEAEYPVRPQESSENVLAVPSGIAYSESIFVPFIILLYP